MNGAGPEAGPARPGAPSRTGLWLRSGLFWLVFSTSVVLFAPVVVASRALPYPRRCRLVHHWVRFVLWWLERCCRLTWRVSGVEHIPPGPAIVLAKHQSAWETFALQCIFPPQVWVLKRELLWIPFFGWGLAALEPIAIDRGAGRHAVDQLVEQGTRRLQVGRWVIVFPEGTRVAPGERGRYRIGGAVLAERSGVPVVPVAHNAGRFWPRRGFLKYPGVVDVRVLSPIDPRGKSAKQILDEAEAAIEGAMAGIDALHERTHDETS